MNTIKWTIYVTFAFLMVFMLFYFSSALSDTMTVEANIFANTGGGNSTIIRVEVPDYLFFGNVTNFDKSEELKVYVNNTGNVDITVTPGKEGVEKQFDIYCNGLRKAKDLNLCELDPNERDAKTCFSEQTYRYLIRTDEKSGECYAEFRVISSFDNVLEKVRGYFTIR